MMAVLANALVRALSTVMNIMTLMIVGTGSAVLGADGCGRRIYVQTKKYVVPINGVSNCADSFVVKPYAAGEYAD